MYQWGDADMGVAGYRSAPRCIVHSTTGQGRSRDATSLACFHHRAVEGGYGAYLRIEDGIRSFQPTASGRRPRSRRRLADRGVVLTGRKCRHPRVRGRRHLGRFFRPDFAVTASIRPASIETRTVIRELSTEGVADCNPSRRTSAHRCDCLVSGDGVHRFRPAAGSTPVRRARQAAVARHGSAQHATDAQGLLATMPRVAGSDIPVPSAAAPRPIGRSRFGAREH